MTKIDERVKQKQGWICISPSDPNTSGLLYFTKESALAQAKYMNEVSIPAYPNGYDTVYWKEVPEPYQVYSLQLLERIFIKKT